MSNVVPLRPRRPAAEPVDRRARDAQSLAADLALLVAGAREAAGACADLEPRRAERAAQCLLDAVTALERAVAVVDEEEPPGNP